jgi:PEP-CTERM motif-containing protein
MFIMKYLVKNLSGLILGACIAGTASANVIVDLIDFTATGGEFIQTFADGDLTGTLTGVGVDVVLTNASGFTWADDFTILFDSEGGLTAPLLQVGGFSDAGALQRFSWSHGSSGVDGTTVIEIVNSFSPIDPFSVYIGNGYASGGPGTWNGNFTLFGVDAVDSAVPAPATLALFGLGLAGLGWSRRKKA